METKVKTLRQAIAEAGIKEGMRISFHHHLRNGDYVLNMVMEEIAAMGVGGLTVNASALFDIHLPLIDHIRNGAVTALETNYVSKGIGTHISSGIMEKPVDFRTHGGRPKDIVQGVTPIDIAFVAAATADPEGNATGKVGKSACGSLGYPMEDAIHAKNVIVITDNLVPSGEYRELEDPAIKAENVSSVVVVDEIGDPKGIVSGTTKITEDPTGLFMAETAAKIIQASGYLKDGFSFQTGAGGASLAASKYLKEIMLDKKIRGSFALGGITGQLVDMMNEGCFERLLDVQCFDLDAVASINKNPNHFEISASRYASPIHPNAAVNDLDVVILGATEIDTDFNVNVHTDSKGSLMGGAGGHSDASHGAKVTMIIAPLYRGKYPIVLDRVTYVTTPGEDIDILVTQAGVAVNTNLEKNRELEERIRQAGIDVKTIHELKSLAEEQTGKPAEAIKGETPVARILYRDDREPSVIFNAQ